MTVLIRYCIKITIRSLAGVLYMPPNPPGCWCSFFLFFVLFIYASQKPCLSAVWKHNNINLYKLLEDSDGVSEWLEGHRTVFEEDYKVWNLPSTFCLLLHTLKYHLLKTRRWMHDYCPIKCFLFPHKSIFSQLNLELLIMPLPLLIFSGLLLNFTVVGLPLPESSLQCFYFPCSVLF